MTDKTGVKLEERIVYAYGGKGGDVLKNEIKMEGSFVFRTKMEVPPAPPKLGIAASTYVVFDFGDEMYMFTSRSNFAGYSHIPRKWLRMRIFTRLSRIHGGKRC